MAKKRTYPKERFAPRENASRIPKSDYNVRFRSPDEYELVQRAAAARDMSMNKLIVEAALEAARYMVPADTPRRSTAA